MTETEDQQIAVLQDGLSVAMPRGPKGSTRRLPKRPCEAGNEFCGHYGISLVYLELF